MLYYFSIFAWFFSCERPENHHKRAADTAVQRENPDSAVESAGQDAIGTTRFVRSHHIALGEIAHISRFRSAVGHDYSDDVEICRSMKHYFWPRGGEPGGEQENWGEIEIFSPIAGEVVAVRQEWAGVQLDIRSTLHPNYHFILFHLSPTAPIVEGQLVEEGQPLGLHIGSQTMSDIAVGVETEEAWQLLSFFDVMTDELFADYQERGVEERRALLISQEERNAFPLHCEEGRFVEQSALADWVELN